VQLNVIVYLQNKEMQKANVGSVICLESGLGIEGDLIRGAEYYRLSAEQGNAVGQYNFAVCLENGTGTGTDLTMARHSYGPAGRNSTAPKPHQVLPCGKP
jgi:TPR repeat protein